jgi:hypothetical protein
MRLYKEGKWSAKETHYKATADVMKFIGRTDFPPSIQQGETATSTPESQKDIFLPNDAHPVLFEYMKQFENWPEEQGKSMPSTTFPTTATRVATGILHPTAPRMAVNTEFFQLHSSEVPFMRDDNTNNVYPQSTIPANPQEFDWASWTSGHLYNDQLLMSALQRNPPNSAADSSMYGGPYAPTGTEAFYGNQPPPQDRIWEQFLSTLMPSEGAQDHTWTS